MKQKSFLRSSKEDLTERFEKIITNDKPFKTLDFSKPLGIDMADTDRFNSLVFDELLDQSSYVGIGGYLENRVIYSNKEHFGSASKARTIHLGIDIWVAAGEAIYAPSDGIIHSFKDNKHQGDYGPTVILSHPHESGGYHTLYGHLSRASLYAKKVGDPIKAGQQVGWVGPYPENGNWPPHLHFQVIKDMQGHLGDYPGVCHIDDLDFYKANCPDPALLGLLS